MSCRNIVPKRQVRVCFNHFPIISHPSTHHSLHIILISSATTHKLSRPCTPGTYSSYDGADVCVPCNAGFYSNASYTSCVSSSISSSPLPRLFSTSLSLPSQNIYFDYRKFSCPAGTFSCAGAAGCNICSPGTYLAIHSLFFCFVSFLLLLFCFVLFLIYYRYSSGYAGACTSCASGTYAPAGSYYCSQCPANTYPSVPFDTLILSSFLLFYLLLFNIILIFF